MPTLISSIKNESSSTLILRVPGFDGTSSITIVAGATVNLLPLITLDEFQALQAQLASMVASGELSTQATVNSSTLVGTVTSDAFSPKTVGSLSFTNVSADIPPTPIFTPTVSGLYLVSYYALAKVDGTMGDVVPNQYISWTDTRGTQTNFFFPFGGSFDPVYTDGPNMQVQVVYAVAGQPISFRATAGNYATTLRMEYYMSVQQL